MPNFVAMATEVGHGGIFLTSFNSLPRKPFALCKNLGDIFRRNRIIAYFVSNFVAIATGGSVGVEIFLTSFNGPTMKTPIGARISEIFHKSRAITDFG